MVYNFATAIRVTHPHIVTIRAVAQGRSISIVARTTYGVVLLKLMLLVDSVLSVTGLVNTVGRIVAITAGGLIRCAVSRSCKIYNLGASPIIMRQAEESVSRCANELSLRK